MNALARVWRFLRSRWGFIRRGPALLDELAYLHRATRDLQAHVRQLDAQRALLETQLGSQRASLEARWREHDERLHRMAEHVRLDRPRPDPAWRESFDQAFQAECRGSFDDVRQRLEMHRHWVDRAPPGPALDLGCGRGEWLDLMRAWGRAAQGVDLAAANVQAVKARGLDASQADAVPWLMAQPAETLALVTAFHLAEHLPFDDLVLVLQHARRVLRPGGVLIIEVPNAENLEVASHTFWLDPTHRRLLPAGLLDLLARSTGWEVLTLQRLNAPEAWPGHADAPVLQRMLNEGRDLALVARRPAA